MHFFLAQETSWPIWEAIDQTHQSHGPIYVWYIYRSMCHKNQPNDGWYGNGWLFHGVPMIPNELHDGPLSQAIRRVFSRHIFCHKRWKLTKSPPDFVMVINPIILITLLQNGYNDYICVFSYADQTMPTRVWVLLHPTPPYHNVLSNGHHRSHQHGHYSVLVRAVSVQICKEWTAKKKLNEKICEIRTGMHPTQFLQRIISRNSRTTTPRTPSECWTLFTQK